MAQNSIERINKKYYQKSELFLYPILSVPRELGFISCYMSWENKYSIEDKKLICLFDKNVDKLKILKEKKHLLQHELFHDLHEIDDKRIIYVFNFQKFGKDWDKVINGKYSKLSTLCKMRVNSYYKETKLSVYLQSYLYPEKFYDVYASLLGVDKELLESGVELLASPDFEREQLKNAIILLTESSK